MMIEDAYKGSRMTSKDFVVLTLVVLIYGVISFIHLGSTQNPQTFWNTKSAPQTATINLGAERQIHSIRHFSGARFGKYNLLGSNDGVNYTLITVLDETKVFAWFDTEIEGNYAYLQIEPTEEDGIIGEIGIYDKNGKLIRAEGMDENARLLLDEQQAIPETISYLNSTYFDEIYHARTGYEYVHDMDIYEYTHPPLGKLIIGGFIKMFGMAPFYYRLPGNIAGILLLVVIYIFAKRMFKETKYAFLAAAVLALDGMHFVQTRIATVDSFLVLFILLAYLFMYQYTQCDTKGGLGEKLVNLFFSGLFMGAAMATKWNGTYCAVGLAVIFFIDFFIRVKRDGINGEWRKQSLAIIGSCIVFFIMVPILVYLMAYIPFMLKHKETPLKDLWDLQVRMYKYHSELKATHPFSSPWYLWPLGIKPMWYYDGAKAAPSGWISTIALHSNPFIWWTGIAAIIYTFIEAIKEGSRKCIFLSVSILSAYLPYVGIKRVMFLYHYFPVVPLMILAIVGALKTMQKEKQDKCRNLLTSYFIIALFVFVFFYPVYSGMMVPRWYGVITQWLGVWNLK